MCDRPVKMHMRKPLNCNLDHSDTIVMGHKAKGRGVFEFCMIARHEKRTC